MFAHTAEALRKCRKNRARAKQGKRLMGGTAHRRGEKGRKVKGPAPFATNQPVPQHVAVVSLAACCGQTGHSEASKSLGHHLREADCAMSCSIYSWHPGSLGRRVFQVLFRRFGHRLLILPGVNPAASAPPCLTGLLAPTAKGRSLKLKGTAIVRIVRCSAFGWNPSTPSSLLRWPRC